jgi:hypothetical protein
LVGKADINWKNENVCYVPIVLKNSPFAHDPRISVS